MQLRRQGFTMRVALEETIRQFQDGSCYFRMEGWQWVMLKQGCNFMPDKMDSVGLNLDEVYFNQHQLSVSPLNDRGNTKRRALRWFGR